ncbi:hypothetical protein [Cronobacter dublinensis]|uniref:hypothetical protein n=1 Tax=Cronobacter dublinensis TaxID=413497 RepID=UPI00300DBFCA
MAYPALQNKNPLNINAFFFVVNSQFFFKKGWTHANDNDYYCHAFRGNPNGIILKARHCSHCFQYFLASRVLAFFLPDDLWLDQRFNSL